MHITYKLKKNENIDTRKILYKVMLDCDMVFGCLYETQSNFKQDREIFW